MQEQKTTDSSQIFKEWLVGNIGRFKYKPTLVKTNIDCVNYRFNGLIDDLILQLSSCGIEIVVVDSDDEFWAFLHEDIEIYPKIAQDNKHYCELCTKPTYYNSINELYIKHSFEPLLEWINNMGENHYMYYIADPDTGPVDAPIIDHSDNTQRRPKNWIEKIVPVVKSR